MQYIGKCWLKDPCRVEEVGERLGLIDAKKYGDDLVGLYRLEGWDFKMVIVLVHVSWDDDKGTVSKIRLWAHLDTDVIDYDHLEEELERKMDEMRVKS